MIFAKKLNDENVEIGNEFISSILNIKEVQDYANIPLEQMNIYIILGFLLRGQEVTAEKIIGIVESVANG